MRYLIQLLQTEAECRYLTDLRYRVAARIGTNKALHYPTPHVTLIWNIEDGPGDPEPIDRRSLESVLDSLRARGSIALTLRGLTTWVAGDRRHVVFPIVDSSELSTLREDLLARVKTAVAGPGGRYPDRAAQVQAQSTPHLTIAQDVTEKLAETAVALIGAESRTLTGVRGVEVVLLERRPPEPYDIVHRVDLSL